MFYRYKNIYIFIKKEKFFSFMIFLFIILTLINPSLIIKIPRFLDIDSLSIIISLLLISQTVEMSGILNMLSFTLLKILRISERTLFAILLLTTEAVSAIFMNDTSLFIFIPFIISLSRNSSLDLVKSVIFITLAANIGSSLTPIGNPQNIIIWQKYNVGFLEFIIFMLPFFVINTTILLFLSFLFFPKKRINITIPPKIFVNKKLTLISILLFASTLFLSHIGLNIEALAVTVIVLSIFSREILKGTDYILILLFALIFINFNEISYLLVENNLINSVIIKKNSFICSVIISQIISNVPATIILSNFLSNWKTIALGVNIGGTGLIIGSLANIITLRLTNIKINDFHKISLPYFVIILIITKILLILNII